MLRVLEEASRHNCNQIPRGRDQQKAGPGHQTGPTAGGGRATTDRETGQRGKTQDRNNGAHPHTKRSATKPRKQRDAPTEAPNQDEAESPAAQSTERTA